MPYSVVYKIADRQAEQDVSTAEEALGLAEALVGQDRFVSITTPQGQIFTLEAFRASGPGEYSFAEG